MYRRRRGGTRVASATAAGQPQRVGAITISAIAPAPARTIHRSGERAYGEKLITWPTWLVFRVPRKSAVAWGARSQQQLAYLLRLVRQGKMNYLGRRPAECGGDPGAAGLVWVFFPRIECNRSVWQPESLRNRFDNCR